MQITEMTFDDAAPVDSYGPDLFRIGGKVFRGAVLARGETVTKWAGLDDIAALLALRDDVDIILLGTGATMMPVPAPMREAVEAAGMGIDPMSTPAACRTYNVLLAEARRVALAALPV